MTKTISLASGPVRRTFNINPVERFVTTLLRGHGDETDICLELDASKFNEYSHVFKMTGKIQL